MKKTACILPFCLLLSISVFAQDWNLIAADSKYNFRSPQADLVSFTLKVESVALGGADSVFLISPQKAVYFFDYPYIGLVGNIFGDSLIKHPGAVYECRFKQPLGFVYPQETTIIHAKAAPGASWAFKPGVTATVSEQKDTVCWGIADSVKIISLSDGKTIRLSKNFGVLSMKEQTLVGLEGKDIGTQLPVLADFYSDWVNGAVFEHFGSYRYDYNTHTKIWTKYYVQGKTVTPDSIKINVRKLLRREQYQFTELDTVIFEDKQELFVVLNPQSVQYPGVAWTGNFGNYTSTYYRNTPQGLELSMNGISTPAATGVIHSNVYVAGIGQTSREFSVNYPGFYTSIVENLPGYRKAGGTEQGTIHPDTFFGVTNSSQEISDLDRLTVYPNPAGSVVFIQCDDCPQIESAEWTDQSGKVIKTAQNPVYQSAMQVDDLPKGMFFLRIRAAGNFVAMRKVVLR